MFAQAGPGRLVHARDVDRARVPERVVPAQRIRRGRVVAHPVGVAPPQRGEPRVEPVLGAADRPHPEVGRQQPGQPVPEGSADGRPLPGGKVPGAGREVPGGGRDLARRIQVSRPPGRGPRRRGQVQVRDLAAGVHPGVGAPGHGERRSRSGLGQDQADGVLEHLLNGAETAGLTAPAVKA